MKFKLLGNGFIAPRHKEAIESIGGEVVEDYNDADCVVVLTPNDLHYGMVIDAHDRGKIVLCEKPMVIGKINLGNLIDVKNVYTVLQLRYHPLAKQLKEEFEKGKLYEIEMDIAVHRDTDYFNGWKGDRKRSGGILYNLGIHYFDLLLWIFGPAIETKLKHEDQSMAFGTIMGKNYACKWRLQLDARKYEQHRTFRVNGKDYNFSSKDNLAEENLHKFVYQGLIKGKGITPKEVSKSINLIENLLYDVI